MRQVTALFVLLALSPRFAEAATKVEPETRVRLDIGPNLLYRGKAEGTPQLFDSSPRVSGWLRIGIWRGAESPTCGAKPWRWGGWFGYRYEPGVLVTALRSNTSSGIDTWMLAHDLSLGLMSEYAWRRGCDVAGFVRLHAAPGLTLSTLQLKSRDDGHLYTTTRAALNATGTAELGGRLGDVLELFVGFGVFWAHPKAELELKQSDVSFGTSESRIKDVSRTGLLAYTGIGVEF